MSESSPTQTPTLPPAPKTPFELACHLGGVINKGLSEGAPAAQVLNFVYGEICAVQMRCHPSIQFKEARAAQSDNVPVIA
jgi:hypothetical protein